MQLGLGLGLGKGTEVAPKNPRATKKQYWEESEVSL